MLKVWLHIYGDASYARDVARGVARTQNYVHVVEGFDDESNVSTDMDVLITTGPALHRMHLSPELQGRVHCRATQVFSLGALAADVERLANWLDRELLAYEARANERANPVMLSKPWMHTIVIPWAAGEHEILCSGSMTHAFVVHEIRVSSQREHDVDFESVVYAEFAQARIELGAAALGAWQLYVPVALPADTAWRVYIKQPEMGRLRRVTLLGTQSHVLVVP